MGEWKAQISVRVRQQLRRDLEAFAERERRKLGNVVELLLQWAFERLKEAFSSVQGSSQPPRKSYWRSYCLFLERLSGRT
jgi:hypothetical protein